MGQKCTAHCHLRWKTASFVIFYHFDISEESVLLRHPSVEDRVTENVPPTGLLSGSAVWWIEHTTYEQSSLQECFWHRSHRLAASKFHGIMNERKKVIHSFLQRLFANASCTSSLSNFPSKHGHRQEENAATNSISTMHGHGGVWL